MFQTESANIKPIPENNEPKPTATHIKEMRLNDMRPLPSKDLSPSINERKVRTNETTTVKFIGKDIKLSETFKQEHPEINPNKIKMAKRSLKCQQPRR